MSVVVYGYETWSFTLWDVRRRKVFGNRVLRRMVGPKKEEVMGHWRKLHVIFGNQIKENEVAGA